MITWAPSSPFIPWENCFIGFPQVETVKPNVKTCCPCHFLLFLLPCNTSLCVAAVHSKTQKSRSHNLITGGKLEEFCRTGSYITPHWQNSRKENDFKYQHKFNFVCQESSWTMKPHANPPVLGLAMEDADYGRYPVATLGGNTLDSANLAISNSS